VVPGDTAIPVSSGSMLPVLWRGMTTDARRSAHATGIATISAMLAWAVRTCWSIACNPTDGTTEVRIRVIVR
jgi:hypothetical protein